MFNESWHAIGNNGVGASNAKKDVLGGRRIDREPAWIIKGSCINADRVWKALEAEPKLCAAVRAEVNVYNLARACRHLIVDRGRSGKHGEVIRFEYRLDHISRPGCFLAEATVADCHPAWLCQSFEANASAKTTSLMACHLSILTKPLVAVTDERELFKLRTDRTHSKEVVWETLFLRSKPPWGGLARSHLEKMIEPSFTALNRPFLEYFLMGIFETPNNCNSCCAAS